MLPSGSNQKGQKQPQYLGATGPYILLHRVFPAYGRGTAAVMSGFPSDALPSSRHFYAFS